MIPHIGVTELLIVSGVVLLIFGPQKLPQLGGAIGKAIKNFKGATSSKETHEDTPEDKREV